MKIACVTTTINVPRVLALYAKYGADVTWFIVGDMKSPHDDIARFLSQHDINSTYYSPDAQRKLGYKCSELIGWNCIQRRNIGFLEALKWGADVVVSIDDDNIPLDAGYFLNGASRFFLTIGPPYLNFFHGLKATSPSGWFDIGTLLQPKAEHRGFPHTKRAEPVFESITDAKVGVVAGLCLGDPDISAVTRIANGPIVHNVSEIAKAGVVVDPCDTWTVFNSQNTAIIRELVPAWFMIPHLGRADDIFASLIVQRVMRETGHVVHHGSPCVWQSRNQHDLTKDLLDELICMRQVLPLADALNAWHGPTGNVVSMTRSILVDLDEVFPKPSIEAALAFLDDCERVI